MGPVSDTGPKCSCGATWTGLNICHCAAAGCHQTFSVERWFKFHRNGSKCADPATLKVRDGKDGPFVTAMKLNQHGVWVGALPNPRLWENK